MCWEYRFSLFVRFFLSPPSSFQWGSCCSIFSFLCTVLQSIICLFSLLLSGNCIVCLSLIQGFVLFLFFDCLLHVVFFVYCVIAKYTLEKTEGQSKMNNPEKLKLNICFQINIFKFDDEIYKNNFQKQLKCTMTSCKNR